MSSSHVQSESSRVQFTTSLSLKTLGMDKVVMAIKDNIIAVRQWSEEKGTKG